MEFLASVNVADYLVPFLTGNSAYSAEMQSFWMAIQGSVAIRDGLNKDRHMQWFHSFVFSVIAGYGGGLLGFIWMGRPTAMLSNDLNIASCILAWIIVNCMPNDIGYKICKTIPVVLVTTSFAQIFRATGIVKFVNVCFNEFKGAPSAYYPIPVFGPILYATLLGNMSGIVMKGLEDHISHGMPWPFQNGIFCATFYHFYANDKTGLIGTSIRNLMNLIPASKFINLSDEIFAACAVAMFMQVMGIIQLQFPNFSPFSAILLAISNSSAPVPSKEHSITSNINAPQAPHVANGKKENEKTKADTKKRNTPQTPSVANGTKEEEKTKADKKKKKKKTKQS